MRALAYLLASGILSVFAMPAHAVTLVIGDATVVPSPGSTSGFTYMYSLGADPSLSATAGTFAVPPNPDTQAGSGFVTLNYYYAVVGGVAGTYVPVTITGSVTASAGGVDGESQASINYANGGVNTENYGAGEIVTNGFSSGAGGSAVLNTTYDVLSDPTAALVITLYVDVNAATGGQALGTSSASAGADPVITIDPSYVAEGYSLEFSPNLSSTPLPSTWLMLLSGFLGLGFFVYRGTSKGSAATAAV
jgi:hypothetical protein